MKMRDWLKLFENESDDFDPEDDGASYEREIYLEKKMVAFVARNNLSFSYDTKNPVLYSTEENLMQICISDTASLEVLNKFAAFGDVTIGVNYGGGSSIDLRIDIANFRADLLEGMSSL